MSWRSSPDGSTRVEEPELDDEDRLQAERRDDRSRSSSTPRPVACRRGRRPGHGLALVPVGGDDDLLGARRHDGSRPSRTSAIRSAAASGSAASTAWSTTRARSSCSRWASPARRAVGGQAGEVGDQVEVAVLVLQGPERRLARRLRVGAPRSRRAGQRDEHRALAAVGQPDDSGVDRKAQLEREPRLLARRPRRGVARRLAGRGPERAVADAARRRRLAPRARGRPAQSARR